MAKSKPVLSLRIRCRMREIRSQSREHLRPMAALTGVPASLLSQIERGERLPKPRDMDGLERGYGDRRGWYEVELKEE